MPDINRPINSAFVFPKGTAEKIKDKKISKESYAEIKRQAEILRKCINKNQNTNKGVKQ